MSLQILNNIYEPLHKKSQKILHLLKEQNCNVTCQYYNQHYVKVDNQWVMEYYPIPVLTLYKLCTIGFDVTHIFIEFIFKRDKALEFDFSTFHSYTFEVYGINNFLNDFYNKDSMISEIADRILNSDELEIGVIFYFDINVQEEILVDTVYKLKEIINSPSATSSC